MVVAAPVLEKSDPRSTERVYPYHLPLSEEWSEYSDWYGQTAMTSAAAGMFIKQPLWVKRLSIALTPCSIVWGAFALAVFGFVNSQPLRQGKESSSPLLVLGMALAGVAGSVLPKMMLAPVPRQAAVL
ncbi:uncharacterized protein L203_103506 [Cryptococcus depauperatus CBS 7841]|uniref:Uncharacterized protein n=1 Tax=Cryptococcus depauperatus CBS 7841 TaxID=1295531 RepID=A0AAJ8JTV4_9TREE